ncbi:MAG TPA: glycosyltransferase family 9 protein, partial [Sedimentisphaerales bacterium]|nr:glycosyltransferase family 9 protein [Sedimentisphaerales bacterium]
MTKASESKSPCRSGKFERKVLILKPSAMGDIVMALPAVRSIKLGMPGVKICWLVNKGFVPLLQNNPFVDEVIEFDRQLLSRMWRSFQAWEAFQNLVARLRSEKFDVALDFQGLLRTALLGWLSGCKVRIGMKDAREGATFFYTDLVARPCESMHVVDHYIEMAETLWLESGKPVFELGSDDAARQRAGRMLEEAG